MALAARGLSLLRQRKFGRIHILELDKKIRLDVCDKCQAYLKTYCDEDEENIYLLDWTTLHLDLLAEERGLHKCGAVELE